MHTYLFWLLAIGIALFAWLAWTAVRPTLFARRVRRVVQEFAQTRKELEAKFFRAASASGKPRGLSWKQVAFQDGIVLGRDQANGEMVGLVAVTIGFAAIEGGGMEDVEAVGNLRAATAVFQYHDRAWRTDGRAVFNLSPVQAIAYYKQQVEPVAPELLRS